MLDRFLFEGEMGKILYTGDFRVSEGDVSRFRQLHHLDGSVKVIDKLYLDTTFLSHQFMKFPSRLFSISIICSLITSWLQEGSHNEICIQMPGNEAYLTCAETYSLWFYPPFLLDSWRTNVMNEYVVYKFFL